MKHQRCKHQALQASVEPQDVGFASTTARQCGNPLMHCKFTTSPSTLDILGQCIFFSLTPNGLSEMCQLDLVKTPPAASCFY